MIEFIIFNGSQIGLDIKVFGAYREFVLKFNPVNGNIAIYGGFYRLDGNFGKNSHRYEWHEYIC